MHVTAFYSAVCSFAFGIGVATMHPLSVFEAAFLLVVSIGVGLIARRRSEAPSARYLWLAGLALCVCALGIIRFELAEQRLFEPTLVQQEGTQVQLEGFITREPDVRENTTHLYVETESSTLLVTTERYGVYQYGDVVQVSGELQKPAAFETDLGRTFNYPGYLEARGVTHMIRYGEVEVRAADSANPGIAALLTFKHLFMEQLEQVLPEPQVGLAEGLLLGVKRALGDDLEAAFRSTGIIHIVVLSGYNIMLVVAFVTYVMAFVVPFRYRVFFGIAAIVAFALMVGLSATVVRASIMASLLLIAQATHRMYFVLRGLVLAAGIMLLINPHLLIYDTGFQLSFMATLGLLLVAPHLETKLTMMPSRLGLREFLTATLATQIFVLPILLYQIGEFSVVAVAVNVLVLPMVPVAMLLTFITGMIAFVSTAIAVPLAYVTYLSLSYILVVVELFAALPFASYVVPAFPFWVVIVSYAGLGYVLYRFGKPDSSADVVEDWTIDEDDTVEQPKNDTPVFFK